MLWKKWHCACHASVLAHVYERAVSPLEGAELLSAPTLPAGKNAHLICGVFIYCPNLQSKQQQMGKSDGIRSFLRVDRCIQMTLCAVT